MPGRLHCKNHTSPNKRIETTNNYWKPTIENRIDPLTHKHTCHWLWCSRRIGTWHWMQIWPLFVIMSSEQEKRTGFCESEINRWAPRRAKKTQSSFWMAHHFGPPRNTYKPAMASVVEACQSHTNQTESSIKHLLFTEQVFVILVTSRWMELTGKYDPGVLLSWLGWLSLVLQQWTRDKR